MTTDVPHREAVELLRRMLDAPDQVRAIVAVDDATYGPIPFFTAWRGCEAEVTLTFNGGVVLEVASARIGDRFENASGWGDNPWDELTETEGALLELSLRGGEKV